MADKQLVKGLGAVVMGYALLLASPSAQAFSWQSVLQFIQTMKGTKT